jgi:hypothetical protein
MRALLKRDSFRYFKMGRMYNKADVRAMILYLLARIDINYKINNIIIKIINQRYFKR